MVLNHGSKGILPFLTTKNRFDLDLTGKMTELDRTKNRFGIFSKNPIKQGVTCVVVYILSGVYYEMVYMGSKTLTATSLNRFF